MPPEGLPELRRILVVRLDNLGDVVLTSPMARSLRAAWPEAELTLLASPGGAPAAELLPWYDRVITLRAVWQDLGGRLPFDPDRELALVARLRAGGYDAVFVCTSFSQTPYAAAYAAYLAGIPVRVGHAPDFGGSVLSHPVVPPPDGTHQAERNLALLDALGIRVPDRYLEVELPPAAVGRAGDWLAAAGIDDREAVALVPGASCAARRWPADRYARVAAGLVAAGRRVVVLGTEQEVPVADTIVAAVPSVVSLAGWTTFADTAAVISRAGAVVCGNSAALHLADALGRPVVALYSGTDRESEWGPRRSRATLLRIPTACAPCRRFECPFELACLEIDPAIVVQEVLALETEVRPAAVSTPEQLAAAVGEEDRWVASAS
jgi:lipopolysaccharide heptosyltransferase II